MSNEYYTASGYPGTGATGSSSLMRAELELVEAGLDKMPILSGNGDLPVFVNAGGTALTTVSASTARTNLGLALGSDVQAYDAGLDSISGLTTVADRMIYTTASDTYAVTTLTTFARTLLAETNAAGVRDELNLGSMAVLDSDGSSLTNITITNLTIDTDITIPDDGSVLNVGKMSLSGNSIDLTGEDDEVYIVTDPRYSLSVNDYRVGGAKQSPSTSESRNSTTTLTASSRFSTFTLDILGRWSFECMFFVTTDSLTPNFKWRFDVSGSGTVSNFRGVIIEYEDGEAPVVQTVDSQSTDIVSVIDFDGRMILFKGAFTLSSDSVDIDFVWSQNVSDGDNVTVGVPSYIKFNPMG